VPLDKAHDSCPAHLSKSSSKLEISCNKTSRVASWFSNTSFNSGLELVKTIRHGKHYFEDFHRASKEVVKSVELLEAIGLESVRSVIYDTVVGCNRMQYPKRMSCHQSRVFCRKGL